MKKYSSKSAFTLVELIVVITILAILATIGFVSYTGFTSKARDSSRLAQMKAISNALEGYTTKGKLPLPDDRVTIYANGTNNIVGYQGNAGDSVLNKIGIKEGGKDPSDDKYYTYYVDSKLRNTELLAFLENDPNEDKETTYIPSIEKANATDYTNRIPRPYGSKLGILLDTSNNPIQENTTLRTTGLDIVTTTTSYTAVITKDNKISGTGSSLAFLKDGAGKSCNDIINNDSSKRRQDGLYYINPTGTGTSVQVYCDMTTKGGGWTRTHELLYNALPSSNDANGYKGMFNTTRTFGGNGFTTDISKIPFDEYIYITDDSKANVDYINSSDIYMTAGYKKDGLSDWINAYTIGLHASTPARSIWYYYDNINYTTKYSLSVGNSNFGYRNMEGERLLSTIEKTRPATNMPFGKQGLSGGGWCVGGTYDCATVTNGTSWNDWASLWIR